MGRNERMATSSKRKVPQRKSVFLLWHSRDLGNGETNDKLIGVYSSEAQADAARLRKLQFEGFRDAPDGFEIARYELDRDYWSEGYIA